MPRAAWAALCCLCCLLGHAAAARKLAQGPAPAGSPDEFVRIVNGEFVVGCERFLLAGWNQWEVVEAAAGAPSLTGASLPPNTTGPQLVRELLAKGKETGFNVMRTWAHSVNPQYAVQTAPGRYNEAALRGLDYLLDEARKAGIRLILAFTSNWTPTGGVPEYLKWAGSDQQVDFFTSPAIKQMFQGWVETLVSRVNTINGRTYRDDPTIMAWNLLNEPRCNGCPNGTVAAWYDEMARFTKEVDPNHLVSTGEEGFYACCGNPANPGQPWTEWAAEEGQDFIADHSSPAIDFATIHAWVDNWQQVDPAWLVRWITDHARDSRQVLNKPLVLEEHGKWVTKNATIGGKFVAATLEERNSFMDVSYEAIDRLLADPASGLKGTLFWQWFAEGQRAPQSEGGGRGLFGIYASDDAFAPIADNARTVAELNKQPVAGCTPSARVATLPPAPDCQATWVNGTPGTGLEGPRCDIPINECVRGTAACDPHATCIDTQAGYECQCWWGYRGDGATCTADPAALAQLEQLYWSEPQGLSCDAGYDVAWPATAPGFLYDPLDSFSFFRKDGADLGSRTNISLLECMVACQEAADCESFVINEVLAQCFLKKEQCPSYNFCFGEEVLCNSTNDRGETFSQPCGFWRSYYRLDMDVEAACANVTYVEPPGAPSRANDSIPLVFQEWEDAYLAKYGEQLARINPAAEPGTAGPAAATVAPDSATPPTSTVQLLDPAEAPLVQAASSGGGTSA